jgi:hypothetical protein
VRPVFSGRPAPARAVAGCALAIVLVVALLLGGCAQPPQKLYLWENFTRIQYDALLRSAGAAEGQLQALQAHVEKARAGGARLPPGLRAHLGMLYLDAGKPAEAREAWLAEKAAFPESGVYMDQLLKRLEARQAPAPTTTPAARPQGGEAGKGSPA